MKVVSTLAGVLVYTHGNQAKAARILKVNRGSLAKRIPSDGIAVMDDGRVFTDTGDKIDVHDLRSIQLEQNLSLSAEKLAFIKQAHIYGFKVEKL